MDIMYNVLAILLAIVAAQPVILVKSHLNNIKTIKNITTLQNVFFCIKLLLLTIVVYVGYGFFIYKNISLAVFYPVVKTVEIMVPVIIGVVIYNEKLNMYNYLGLLFLLLGIICIEA
jgi:multidrug transporter EmrE-like cation transporter